MKTEEYIALTEENILHTYNRFPLVLSKGEGVYLYDTEGKKYLDLAAGIAVYSLGYGNSEFNDALKDQIDKFTHCSNLFYNENMPLAAKALTESTGLSKVFFTNSGTEAVEGAIKAAKKYKWNKTKSDELEIIAMENSFHGRSVGSLSVTGNPHYHEGFKPLMGGVKFAKFNDIGSVEALICDNTAAIILETVQGEGGIYPAEPSFIKRIREICDEKDIVMILDEVQCGMGRTGKMWAYEHYGIKPDIAACAKALGNGVPVGAFVLGEKLAANSLVPGDHGSTYGGNPFVCAAVNKVFELYGKYNVVSKAEKTGKIMEEALLRLKAKHSCIKDVRGLGLIRGVELDPSVPVSDVISKARDMGIIMISAGNNVIRLVPPLVIEEEHVAEMERVLDAVLDNF